MLNSAPLGGLVLAGGLSSRLGRDKGLLEWHGLPQRLYLLGLFHRLQIPAYLSARSGQEVEVPEWATVIPDAYGQIGPAGALLSAMDARPGYAWLVVACDMPLLNQELLVRLLENRNPAALFTGFLNAYGPDPLAAIWEPSAQPVLKGHIEQGEYSLRRMIKDQQTNLLTPSTPECLYNVNTPPEFAEICRILDISTDNQTL